MTSLSDYRRPEARRVPLGPHFNVLKPLGTWRWGLGRKSIPGLSFGPVLVCPFVGTQRS